MFEAVPPGVQPTRMTPAAMSGGRFNTQLTNTAIAGMATYWAATPSSTGRGLVSTSWKSLGFRVSPMANMITPRSRFVYGETAWPASGRR